MRPHDLRGDRLGVGGEHHPHGHGGARLLKRSLIIEAHGADCVVNVHVQPRSGRTAVAGLHGEALKVRVSEPPVDGRATEAARRAVASAFGLPQSRVGLVSGERSRLKRFRLVGLAAPDANRRLVALLG